MSSPADESTIAEDILQARSGCCVVFFYSKSLPRSVHLHAVLKKAIASFHAIRLYPVCLDDDRQVPSLPLFGVCAAPAAFFFLNGRPFCAPITEHLDEYRVMNILRRLALCDIERDDFESVGTTLTLPPGAVIPDKWRHEDDSAPSAGPRESLLAPLYRIMDSLYDI
jgi:hypothetical protein